MPLYSDPGYTYYSSSGGSLYSPYYTSPLYGSTSSSSSSPYAPYSSTYNRAFSGTYSLPSTSRSARYTTMVSSYQPKLTPITESPLNRSNFIPLTRIKSPKISSYSPSISYIPTPRSTRLKTINTADIDVSATSRYGKHHHMEDRKDEAAESDKANEAAAEASKTTESETKTITSVEDPNSPYMPRADNANPGQTVRSTIKRNRAVVRLSIMRPRSKNSPKCDDNSNKDVPVGDEKSMSNETSPPSPEKSFIQNLISEQSTHMCVTDMIQSQCSETSLNEVLIEVDPITNAVRRLSIPPAPTFHDICEDISSDKIDDDLNAGELRRRASLIQEQEMEIINEVQKSQSGSFQVIHLERNISQDDCRKSRKSKKVKKLRHKITANVEIINPPLTPIIQDTIGEESSLSTMPAAKPKFTFNIEEIEEHKVFKLPKKRVKSVKSKKISEVTMSSKAETNGDFFKDDKESKEKTSDTSNLASPKSPKTETTDFLVEKVGTQKPISKVAKSESTEDFWSKIEPKSPKTEPVEKVATSKIAKSESTEDFWSETGPKSPKTETVEKVAAPKMAKTESTEDFWSQMGPKSPETDVSVGKVGTPKPISKVAKSESTEDFWSKIGPKSPKTEPVEKVATSKIAKSESTEDFWSQTGPISPKTDTVEKVAAPKMAKTESTEDFWSQIGSKSPKTDATDMPVEKVATPKPIRKIAKSESTEDFWSQIGTRETLYMNKRKKTQPPAENTDDTQTVETSTSFKELSDQKTKLDEVKEITTTEEIKIQSNEPPPMSPKTKEKPQKTSVASIWLQDTTDTTNKLLEKSKTSTQPESKVIDKPVQPLSPKKPFDNPKILIEPCTSEATESPAKTLKNSPKSKNIIKTSSKKKSSPKNSVKAEEIPQESNVPSKAKPSATLTATKSEESISSSTATSVTKISSGIAAKSADKRKSIKNIKPTTKQSISKSVSLIEVTSDSVLKEVADLKLTGKDKPIKQESPSTPVTPTFFRKSVKSTAVAKNDAKSNEKVETVKPEEIVSKIEKDSKPSTINETSSPLPPTKTATSSETETVLTPKSTPDVSVAQVQTTTTTTSITESLSSQSIVVVATAEATTITTTKTETNTTVLGSGSNNLSKFATVSNLAQYLLDVDADLEDYIPSSAEESDSSSDSYSGDGSLSASMKKKNKQLRKKAKEAQQAFDPNKKVKIDTKKKCYVKEEAPRYPLVATPRPLWKREKIVYEESSNSSSEETDSESECTTSDEYEDELCPKDAIIRMSTCSNDSGFDGGTTPSSPKKVLDCDVNCHKKCEKLTANLCGVNQKLIVEALACVKRETSYTYLQFQKTGRITAPATTIPRFKKYSVEDFNFLAVLGKGSFGKVLLAELRNTDFYYAVKCLKKDVVLEDDDVECTLIERKVLALGTKHPYLCHLFCTFQTESHLFFVMEYLNGGDLMFHIQESGRFPEERARFYGAEIISGLKFLHKKGIIYRDLKLDNVLLDFDGHVRIADFGMCKLQIYLDKTADSFCGTPDYMAPEIIKGDKYNQNVDWWSFGVLLYEMLIGQSPFSGCDEDELFWSICNEIPWFPVYITTEATSILKGLLEKDYTKRVGSQYSPAGDICDHIFFKDIDWGLLEKRQLAPPFKPQVKHPLDTQYFDRSFTRERVRLTPIDKEILQSMDQDQFQGFSYTNPNATLD